MGTVLLGRPLAVTVKGPEAAAAMPMPSTPATGQDDADLVAALERLAALHRSGHLDDAEFSRAKSQVLRRARGEGR